MNTKLSNIKNIAWAIAIILSLAAVLVGLGFTAFTRHRGEMQRPTVLVGNAAAERDTAAAAAKKAEEEAQQQDPGTVYLLGESGDAGQAYVDSLTFLVDSALIGLRDYGLLSDGTATAQVWGTASGSVPATALASFTIRYPGDGSEISPADAAMIAKPSRLVISLGTDSLKQTNEADFIAGYEALIRGIQQASPDTKIIVCTITSVTGSYSGNDGLDNAAVKDANRWLAQICADTDVYLADAASCVSERDGTLETQYASANGKTPNSAGLTQILQYLRTHAIA
ncbi:MAG: SGNH/GDSL hydrolase family protein [Oscillospiraceae bacterium]|jgi:hypothetical protein|nr:SGNH/GDSL hydrolase family protein [Oscillospiraceae bacterium]